MGCNPAEQISPHWLAEPHPHRPRVIRGGRLHPHDRSVGTRDRLSSDVDGLTVGPLGDESVLVTPGAFRESG
jgi:hypothetical protein